MKTQPFEARTNEDLAKQVADFLGRIESCKNEKYNIFYTLRKELVSLSCYTDNNVHFAILVYDENIKL